MQTPAEKELINELKKIVDTRPGARIINLGAAKSLIIENEVAAAGKRAFRWDRLDVEECSVDSPLVNNCYISSVESMPAIASNSYDAAFANYVLEHVADLPAAVSEINRILKPGGIFVLSTPNPGAPEFRFSHLTPLWFHQLIKGEGEGMRAYETVYAYKNIDKLISAFEAHGFKAVRIFKTAFTEGYLYRFPILSSLSRLYDRLLRFLSLYSLMGNVCITFKKIS